MSNTKAVDSKTRFINLIVVIICGVFFAVTSSYLFYHQIMGINDGTYNSDIMWHLIFATNHDSYSLSDLALGAFMDIYNSPYTATIYQSVIIVATWWVGAEFAKRYFKLEWSAYVVSLIAVCFSTINLPYLTNCFFATATNGVFDVRGLVTQPWHNITYFGMRLFAIVTLYYALDIIENYQEDFSIRMWFQIAIPLFISSFIKPNFLICFSLALLVILIFDFITLKKSLKDKFLSCFFIGSTCLPPALVIPMQSAFLMDSESENGIDIIFRSSDFWTSGAIGVVGKLLLSFALFAIVLFYNYKKESRTQNMMWLMALVGLVFFAFVVETGERAADKNFYWGMFCAGYLLAIYFVSNLVENYKTIWGEIRQKTVQKTEILYLVITAILLILHSFDGIYYYLQVVMGASYAI